MIATYEAKWKCRDCTSTCPGGQCTFYGSTGDTVDRRFCLHSESILTKQKETNKKDRGRYWLPKIERTFRRKK